MLPALGLAGLGVSWACSWDNYGAGKTTHAALGKTCDGVLLDCAEGGTCVANGCRASCTSDDDCSAGTRCLWVETKSSCESCPMNTSNGQAPGDGGNTVVGFCVDNASVACASNCSNGSGGGSSDCGWCPANTTCATDGHCRNSCGNGVPACASPESCVDNYCYGAAGHDSTSPEGGTTSGMLLYTSPSPSVVAADTQDSIDFVSWVSQGDALYLAGQMGSGQIQMGPGTITGLAASGGYVYWGSSGSGVFGCMESNCGPTTRMVAPASNAARVSATSAWVVWIDTGALTVQGCMLDDGVCNGAVQTFASNQGNMTDVATDGTSVYWIGVAGGAAGGTAVFKCPLAPSCSPATLGDVDGAQWIAVNATAVFAAGNSAYTCSSTGTGCTPIAGMTSVAQANQIAADSSGFYAATQAGPFFCGTSCSMGTANPTQLGSDGIPANGIALSRKHVYWSESQGIYIAPKPSGG
jgi:hypothetical protein